MNVTLASGCAIRQAKNLLVTHYIDVVRGSSIRTPNASFVPSFYWNGTAASSFDSIRGTRGFNNDIGNSTSALSIRNATNDPAKASWGASGNSFGSMPVMVFDPQQIVVHVKLCF